MKLRKAASPWIVADEPPRLARVSEQPHPMFLGPQANVTLRV
jgi:hypothetical protein